MRIASLVLAFVFVAGVGDDAPPKEDRDRLQGTWAVLKCHIGEGELPSPDGDHLLSFEGDQMWLTRNGKRSEGASTFTLDPSKTPRSFDFPLGEFEAKGIYEFDGKRLRICYNVKDRPTRFDATERDEAPFNTLYELERK